MTTSTLDLDASHLTRSMTLQVRVHGVRKMALRWWIAAQVLKLAAIISGAHMDVDVVDVA